MAAVDAGFDAHDVPYDVLWLDIEHTDGKRYMTWDASAFPTPKRMIEDVASRGRKMVAIVDPHVKKDPKYPIHREAESRGYYVKNPDGSDFDGVVLAGILLRVPRRRLARRAGLVVEKIRARRVPGVHPRLVRLERHERAVRVQRTGGDDAQGSVHHGGVEHREVHNAFGMYYHAATAEGVARRNGERPFVLSRAFFAGTQRVGPIWTGDNAADWDHLRVSVLMTLTLGLTGLTWSGADVGGFFGNPDAELMTRWYQLGIYYPFFRGHAHLDTKRREPWTFGGAHRAHSRRHPSQVPTHALPLHPLRGGEPRGISGRAPAVVRVPGRPLRVRARGRAHARPGDSRPPGAPPGRRDGARLLTRGALVRFRHGRRRQRARDVRSTRHRGRLSDVRARRIRHRATRQSATKRRRDARRSVRRRRRAGRTRRGARRGVPRRRREPRRRDARRFREAIDSIRTDERRIGVRRSRRSPVGGVRASGRDGRDARRGADGRARRVRGTPGRARRGGEDHRPRRETTRARRRRRFGDGGGRTLEMRPSAGSARAGAAESSAAVRKPDVVLASDWVVEIKR